MRRFSPPSIAFWRYLVALALLQAPVSAAIAAEWISIYVYAEADQPRHFYMLPQSSCERRDHWTNDLQGCVPWLIRQREAALISHEAVGSVPQELGVRFYLIPVCANRPSWKNAFSKRAALVTRTERKEKIMRIKIECR